MHTLLIGERFNNRPRWGNLSPQEWYQLAIRLGAFPDLGRYDTVRLETVLPNGWDSGLNLTPPNRQGMPFDSVFAGLVADLVSRDPRWDTLLLVGRLVASAFGVKRSMPPGSECRLWPYCKRLVFLPHPSGLSRFWNDCDAVENLRMVLEEVLR